MRTSLAYGTVLAALLLLPAALSSYDLDIACKVLIFALFAMSLDMLMGHAGLFSLGHAAYFGVAAYSAAILTARLGSPVWLGLPAGVAAATVAGAVLGPLALRARGSYFLMITLALGQVLWGIAIGWRAVTGGDDGITGVPRLTFHLPAWLPQNASFYYLVLLFTGLGAVALTVILQSPFGCALRGIRESETRMAALGYDVWWYRYLAFVMSGAFAGLAGVLYAFLNNYVGPDSLNVTRSAEVLLMVIAGGVGTLWGPAIGAVLLVVLENTLDAYTVHWVGVLGVIYIAVSLLAPKGIVGVLSRAARRLRPISTGGRGERAVG